MREIKFRAWDADRKWFIYDYDQKISNKYPSVKLGDDIHKTARLIGLSFKKLQQYTGLKDKNGVEIYEGDIVKGGIYLTYEVKWDYEDGGWNISNNVQHHYEVIGNIYENPELLN